MPITQNDITNAYQTALGRAPTQGEISSFMQYGNNGSVPLTPFDIQQIVQGTPEYQQTQVQKFGGQYSDALGASDQRILGLSQNAVTQQFAQQGRNIGSSGYLGAYANAAANLAMSRQQQLATFYGGGYQNIIGNTQGQANRAQDFGQSQQASTLGYNRQQQLLQQYQTLMNQQNQNNRSRGLFGSLGGTIGGLGGAGIGAFFGGIPGATLGANLGSGLGQGIGSYAAPQRQYSAFGQ